MKERESTKMKTIKTNCTDQELSEAVAEALGIPITPEAEWVDYDARSVTVSPAHYKPYATSADAVLPLLEKWRGVETAGMWRGEHFKEDPEDANYLISLMADWGRIRFEGRSPTFPRAACFALLKAHGVEVSP
jgi:hypothetical protein